MTPTKWTVLFIVHAVDEETRVYSEKLFSDLLQTKSSRDVRIFVLHNTYNYKINEDDINATLYEIQYIGDEKNGTGKKIKKRLDAADNLVIDNIGNPDVLSRLLRFVRNQSEGGKFILFTWDHGCGFGIFDITERDQLSFTDNRVQRNAHKTDMLMVGELGKALKKVFIDEPTDGKKRIDLLIMMNCWMHSIETVQELKDTVEILIAPETTIDFLGYNYIDLIDEISDPAYTEKELEELAKKIINDTVEKYEKSQPDIKANELIISATKPAKSDTIVELIIKLASKLREKVKEGEKDLILQRRIKTEELTKEFIGCPWYFVDILDVVTKLSLEDPYLNEIKQNLETELKEGSGYMIKKYIGNNFKKKPYEDNYGGVSICFPYIIDDFINGDFYKNFYSLSAKHRISFPDNAIEWPLFIEELIKESEDQSVKVEAAESQVAKSDTKQDDIGENFLLDLEILINIDSTSKIRIDSFVAGCTKMDSNGKIDMVKIRSGAGDPKRHGAGDPKRHGAGDPKRHGAALIKLRGAGDPKRHGAGQFILGEEDLIGNNNGEE
jgi:hypothetical protein